MKVIAVVGPIASGKGTVGKILAEKGYKKYELSSVIVESLKKEKLSVDRENKIKMGNKLREQFGSDYLARKTAEIAEKERSELVVLDGVRNPAEVEFLKKEYEAKIIGVTAPVELRSKWYRLREREGDKKEDFERLEKIDRGEGQPEHGQRVEDTLEMADVVIINNWDDPSKEKLKEALREVIISLGIEATKNEKEKV